MSEDRLEEAKQYFNLTMNAVITEYGIGLGLWLISEIEKCRAEIQRVRKRNENLKVNVHKEIEKYEAELEKCRKDVADWKGLTSKEQDAGMRWKDRAEKAETELTELTHVFEYQTECMENAQKMWQKATDNPGTLPDLGVLLDWLMADNAELKREGRFIDKEPDRYYKQSEKFKAELKYLKEQIKQLRKV